MGTQVELGAYATAARGSGARLRPVSPLSLWWGGIHELDTGPV